ncbi:MAG: type II secretion system protein [Candidatus Pacebacteria bacterium]|nr:type II secretion system protein [Candidatus Paceibacterota bacterium]
MSLKKKHSFTIIELAIIAAVVALFAGIVIAYFDSINQYSRDSRRKADIDAIRKALLVYSNMGLKQYPSQNDWCCIGATDAGHKCNNLESALSGYISKIPNDPQYLEGSMGRCYMFRTTSDLKGYELYASLEEGGLIYYSQDTKVMRDPREKYSDCLNKPGEDEWISGPGFCVMRYEARKSAGNNCKDRFNNDVPCPVSNGSGDFYNLSFDDAEDSCRSIGAHLMNNAEWMALANNIIKNDANWIDGRSAGSLKRGNIGSDILKGGYNKGNVDVGAGNSLAELKLLNGENIWHFSGNLSEWVNYKEGFTVNPAGSWVDYPAADIASFGAIGYVNIGPDNKEYGSLKGMGKVRTLAGGRYFVRGGNYQDSDSAGIYALDLFSDPQWSTLVGFRCVK